METNQLSSRGERLLEDALHEQRPVVAVLGQEAGWSADHPDPVLASALEKAPRSGDNWNSLLSREPPPETFYEWLGERFVRRAPSHELLAIADAPLSAVYTSSIDPRISNLFASNGREPEPLLLGDPPPRVSRSRRRVPIYYLFGKSVV